MLPHGAFCIIDLMSGRILITLLFFGLFVLRTQAQVDTVRVKRTEILKYQDSLYVPQSDTLFLLPTGAKYKVKQNPYMRSDRFYSSLKTSKDKNRFYRELYAILIRDSTSSVYEARDPIRSEEYYKEFEGHTIRKVVFKSVQIIGGNVMDTTVVSQSRFIKFLNSTSPPTRQKLLNNNLLFEEGDPLDPFELSDTERILRSAPYINDARIYVLPLLEESDAVEVTVVTQDRFPWGIDGSFSGFDKFKIIPYNNNILGSGNQMFVGYHYKQDDEPKHGYSFEFISQPLWSTFSKLSFFAQDTYSEEKYGVRYEKDFVSPDVKYGGSAEFQYLARDYNFVLGDTTYESYFSANVADLWIARALQPFKDQRKNLILGLRNEFVNFNDGPEAELDSNEQFLDRYLILGSGEITKRNFVKTLNVRTIGITEDLPVGFIYGFTLGADFNEIGSRFYSAGRFSWSGYYPFGYLQYYGEIGGFPDNNMLSNGLWYNELRYFTPLFKGRHRTSYRIFSTTNFIQGINLSLPLAAKMRDFMDGVSGDFNRGEQLFYTQLEALIYTHWYWYGFRFAPLALAEYGMVSDTRLEQPFTSNYMAVGGGIRITNPGLIINTFETSFKYFPVTGPDSRSFYFSISVSTPLFIRQNLSTKPRILAYDINRIK